MDFSEISPQAWEEVKQDSDLKTSINGSFMSLNTRTNSLELHYAQYQTSGKRRFKQRRPLTHTHTKDLTLTSTLLLLLLLSRFSGVRLYATPQTAAHQAPLSLGFSRQEYWVGCHFLLQCMKVKSENEAAQSCPTLCDPMDCSPPGSSVHEIFQARALEWVAIAFSNMYRGGVK